jgi:ATP-binding cassette subfamily B protein
MSNYPEAVDEDMMPKLTTLGAPSACTLCRDHSVLIIDEATSALDTHTEHAVMEAIEALQRACTIIMIANLLATLKCCYIIYLDKGKIIDSGMYTERLARSRYFVG